MMSRTNASKQTRKIPPPRRASRAESESLFSTSMKERHAYVHRCVWRQHVSAYINIYPRVWYRGACNRPSWLWRARARARGIYFFFTSLVWNQLYNEFTRKKKFFRRALWPVPHKFVFTPQQPRCNFALRKFAAYLWIIISVWNCLRPSLAL